MVSVEKHQRLPANSLICHSMFQTGDFESKTCVFMKDNINTFLCDYIIERDNALNGESKEVDSSVVEYPVKQFFIDLRPMMF